MTPGGGGEGYETPRTWVSPLFREEVKPWDSKLKVLLKRFPCVIRYSSDKFFFFLLSL